MGKRSSSLACHALDFDACALPCELVSHYPRTLDSKLWDVVAAIVGKTPTAIQRDQALMPTKHGGLQWHSVVETVPLARAADLLENGPALRECLSHRYPGKSAADIRSLDGVDACPQLLDQLAALGVHPSARGLPGDAAVPDALRSPCPERHLLSAYLDRAALIQQ